ncbi:MAG: S8 family serine peptidase [Sporichthyaceae bacterium]
MRPLRPNRRRAVACALAASLIPLAAGTWAEAADVPSALPCNDSTPVDDGYIVTMKADPDTVPAAADKKVQKAEAIAEVFGGTVYARYRSAFKGFAATLTAQGVAALQDNADVEQIGLEVIRCLDEVGPAAPVGSAAAISPAPWGLDRIDQRTLPLDNAFTIADDAGKGVEIYIVDSGIRNTHVQFAGRVAGGKNFVPGGGVGTGVVPEDTGDCDGHGTHVAGSAGARDYGVAAAATIVPVRVFDCVGTTLNSVILLGLDWIAGQRLADRAAGLADVPAVVNLSLGGGSLLQTAVGGLLDLGFTVVVAAGNDSTATTVVDSCDVSPAGVRRALTVAASTSEDVRADFSNGGPCVDLFAPGVEIASTSSRSDTGIEYLDGTSMAAPHVAGAAAVYLGSNPAASPYEVANHLKQRATRNVVSAGGATPNLLLYVGPTD